jgi:hypothetical protein
LPKAAAADSGNRGDRHGGNRHPQQAAAQPEQHDLRDVGRQDLPGGCADALQDRDALDLLLHEHAGDAPHADAPEHDHDEADQAEVILRAQQVLADVVLGRSVRARLHETVAEVAADLAGQAFDLALPDAQQDLVAGAAAEGEQLACAQVVVIDQDPRAEAEGADPPPGLLGDDAADREGLPADDQPAPHGGAELRQQLGPDQRAAAAQQRVRIGPPVLEHHAAVERKRGCTPRSSTIRAASAPPSARTIVAVSMASMRSRTPSSRSRSSSG